MPRGLTCPHQAPAVGEGGALAAGCHREGPGHQGPDGAHQEELDPDVPGPAAQAVQDGGTFRGVGEVGVVRPGGRIGDPGHRGPGHRRTERHRVAAPGGQAVLAPHQHQRRPQHHGVQEPVQDELQGRVPQIAQIRGQHRLQVQSQSPVHADHHGPPGAGDQRHRGHDAQGIGEVEGQGLLDVPVLRQQAPAGPQHGDHQQQPAGGAGEPVLGRSAADSAGMDHRQEPDDDDHREHGQVFDPVGGHPAHGSVQVGAALGQVGEVLAGLVDPLGIQIRHHELLAGAWPVG